VGAILVKDKKILATGYNGAPSRLEHCLDIGCLREKQSIPSGERHELCRGLHAEQNAIIQAAYHGVGIRGATLYCTNHPCIICSKMIINAGIANMIFIEDFGMYSVMELLLDAGIKVWIAEQLLIPDHFVYAPIYSVGGYKNSRLCKGLEKL
jgi:dCMP deaminase